MPRLHFTLFSYCNGTLAITTGAEGIEHIHFGGEPLAGAIRDDTHPILREAARQLAAYFAQDLRAFDLPLAMKGTPFQIRAWQALQQIPYGATRTYAEQARAIGSPAAVRAIGAANGRNPLPIVVPCHRVIGTGGKLTGFGGGLPLKRWLLDLESSPALLYSGISCS